MSAKSERGQVEYTARAFRQDAEDAMRGNIIRGLVELITNADDAYAHVKPRLGRIRVEVEHRRGKPWKVVVRDRATGMNKRELKERIVKLGERTSGFETGQAVRGNRGRGAKDLAAFGKVVFEAIKDDRYAQLVLEQTGAFELFDDVPATEADRKRLGIQRGDGTVVTVEVAPNIRCPRHENLRDQLTRDYRLRFVTTDPTREVVLVNLTNPRETDRLRFEVDDASLDTLFDDDIPIGGYPEAQAHLTVRRLSQPSDCSSTDPARLSGILIRGRRTVYDNTLFAYESNPFALRFRGNLDCPFIDDLANKYDDRADAGGRADESNPIPIISRKRDGLAVEHPFVRAATEACEEILKELVQGEERREQDETRTAVNEQMRRALSRVAHDAARFLQEGLREIEEEEPPVLRGLGTRPLQIVPPAVVLTVGEEKVLSILAAEAGLDGETRVSVAADPSGVVEILDGSTVDLRPHRTRQGILSGQVRLLALLAGETRLACTIAGREELAVLSVRPAANQPPEPPEPPESIEFERPRYTVRWNKRKLLSIRAPGGLVREGGNSVQVKSDNPGVVVRGGVITLSPATAGEWWEGSVKVEGRELGSKATLTAALGSGVSHCRVAVEEKDDILPDLRIEPVHEGEGATYRALFHPPYPTPDDPLTLRIMTKHAGIRAVLGDNWEGQDKPEWKALLVEIVTDAVVRRLMERKYPKGVDLPDAQEFYSIMYSYSTRLVPVLQKGVRLTNGS